jgi:hypothetical protein
LIRILVPRHRIARTSDLVLMGLLSGITIGYYNRLSKNPSLMGRLYCHAGRSIPYPGSSAQFYCVCTIVPRASWCPGRNPCYRTQTSCWRLAANWCTNAIRLPRRLEFPNQRPTGLARIFGPGRMPVQESRPFTAVPPQGVRRRVGPGGNQSRALYR